MAMYPVDRLTAEKLNNAFLEVMDRIDKIGFNPIVICSDNLSANRKFFIKFLGNGKLEPEVRNPINGNPLFVLFDPVHNIKNIYNIFQRKKIFSFQSQDGTSSVASFK